MKTAKVQFCPAFKQGGPIFTSRRSIHPRIIPLFNPWVDFTLIAETSGRKSDPILRII
ncbi:hypothetical protein PE067_01270 [Paracoccus sp. DMF-8]|uniref:hypothetical protein n=1 Tax=Paracoccus sp. DMF-8 TaxID=3019445 RepID=UPI0023E894B9|nr:hypothetical protein [Paracoccus sp. DMF-8]MDF3604900.1 hypothetical protein [Paracoccus sp. DMF-8]